LTLKTKFNEPLANSTTKQLMPKGNHFAEFSGFSKTTFTDFIHHSTLNGSPLYKNHIFSPLLMADL
jgi:hypothetical protein